MRLRKTPIIALVAASLLAAAACSSGGSSTSDKVTDGNNNVPFKACTPQTCSGQVDGANFAIQMPEKWNGTLLIFSPDSPSTRAGVEVAPNWVPGQPKKNPKDSAAEALLATGFALAGSSNGSDGWQVEKQIGNAQSVYNQFKNNIAEPNRTFVWGTGLGALTSANLGQQQSWVNGVAPLCGLLAGVNPNFDIALDAAYSVKRLLAPNLKLVDYASEAEAQANYNKAVNAVTAAAGDRFGGGYDKLRVIAAAAVVPTETRLKQGGKLAGDAYGIAENLRVVLARSTIGRYQIEKQFGGNVSTNVGTNYVARVSTKQAERIDTLNPGATRKYLTIIEKGPRTPANEAARNAANGPGSGTLSGNPKVSTVALHTEYDPVALYQNMSYYMVKAFKAGDSDSRLLSINVISPPALDLSKDPYPYGAGHCNFTQRSIAGTIGVLNDWVRNGKYPTKQSIGDWLGSQSGYDPNFPVQPWPTGPDQIQ